MNFLYLLIISLCFFGKAISQVNYSQFYNTPLLYNPANTGQFNKSYRLGIVSRNGVIAPSKFFSQSTVSFDGKILIAKIQENDCVGIGFYATIERNPDDGVKNSYAAASISYRKALNEDGSKAISAGFQGVLGSKIIEKPRLLFESQIPAWINSGFRNIDITQFGRVNFTYFDFNAGLQYQGLIGQSTFFSVGTSVNHITKPNKLFLGGEFILLPQIWNKLSFEKKINQTNKIYALGLLGLQAGDITDVNTGVIYEYKIKQGTDISAGLFFKNSKIWGNAIIPIVGLNFNSISINLSYDINAFSKSILFQKTSEISLVYTRAKTKESFSETRFIRF